MRSRVLVRNRKPAETGINIDGRSNAKRAKSANKAQDAPAIQEGRERQLPTFELPQLDALLLDLDTDIADSRLITASSQSAVPFAKTSGHGERHEFRLSSGLAGAQGSGASAMAETDAGQSCSYSAPIVSLPVHVQQPAQQRPAHICSISEASSSPAEPQHKQPDHLHNAKQQFPDSSILDAWPVDTQLQSAAMQSGHTYASQQQHLQPNATLSDSPVYAHMLRSMLHMPELSADSNEQLVEQDTQDVTSQSHQGLSAMQASSAHQSFGQHPSQHEDNASGASRHWAHSQQQQAAAIQRTLAHWDLPALTPRSGSGMPNEQYELSFYSSGLDDMQPFCTTSVEYPQHQHALQSAHSCLGPMTVPNVIRKTSSDSTIDPSTGKLLVYGRAMAHRNTEVELPAVSALFSDITSRVSHRSWQAATYTPAKIAARAPKRRRSHSSTPPPMPGMVDCHSPQNEQQPMQPNVHLSTAGSEQQPAERQGYAMQQSPFKTPPGQEPHGSLTALMVSALEPEQMACHAASDAGAQQQGMQHAMPAVTNNLQSHAQPAATEYLPAMQHLSSDMSHAAAGNHTLHHHVASGQNFMSQTLASARASETNSRPKPGGQTYTTQVPLQQQPTGMPPVRDGQNTEIVQASSTEHIAAASGHSATAGVGKATAGASVAKAAEAGRQSAPAGRRFGGILNGVVKEAADIATKRPPVFRYEDLKQKDDGQSFKGVSRQRWSVQWSAAIPKADKDEGEHFLGLFSQESTAARACDVASLKVHGSAAHTNFPAREYEKGMEELQPLSVLDVVMALQRQGAIGQFKNSRYQGVWQLDRSCWEARIEDHCIQDASIADKEACQVSGQPIGPVEPLPKLSTDPAVP